MTQAVVFRAHILHSPLSYVVGWSAPVPYIAEETGRGSTTRWTELAKEQHGAGHGGQALNFRGKDMI